MPVAEKWKSGCTSDCGPHAAVFFERIHRSQHLCRNPVIHGRGASSDVAHFWSDGKCICERALHWIEDALGTLNCGALELSRHEIGEGIWDTNKNARTPAR